MLARPCACLLLCSRTHLGMTRAPNICLHRPGSLYQMVSDITAKERQAEEARSAGLLPTSRLQLSFGAHVIVTMGTFFALGYYLGLLGFGSKVAVRMEGPLSLFVRISRCT